MSRVLVIDDEAALGENIERMLRSPGVTVTVALTRPGPGRMPCQPTRPGLAGRAHAGNVG